MWLWDARARSAGGAVGGAVGRAKIFLCFIRVFPISDISSVTRVTYTNFALSEFVFYAGVLQKFAIDLDLSETHKGV